MEPRYDFVNTAPGAYKAMLGLTRYLRRESELSEQLIYMCDVRASQINGCAFCLDMHWKDLKATGEDELRMYMLPAWRESPFYSDRERAALAWTEAVTNLGDGHVPDEIYDEVRQQFSEKDLADLTLAIATINAWNRIQIASRAEPGHYQPGSVGEPVAT